MSLTEDGCPVPTDEVTVVVVGDSRVGKSAIINTFVHGTFDDDPLPTVGVDFNSKIIQAEGKFVRVHMWDTSGQESFLWASKKHIGNADGFIFVYDVTDEKSFKNMRHWLTQVQRFARAANLPKMLVGNKSDLRHQQVVGASTAKEFGIPEGMIHLETSARLSRYLNVAFYVITTEVLRYRQLGCIVPLGVTSDFPSAAQEANESDMKLVEGQDIEDGPEYKHLFKIFLIGSQRVGKTSLRYRFCKNHYNSEYVATVGFDYSTRTLVLDRVKIKVQVWDVSGDPIYEQTRRNYCKGADGFLMVYDVADMDSFIKAEHLLKELDMCGCDQVPKMLVGNKVDLKKKKRVDFGTAKDFADGWRIPVIETSSREGVNVDAAFTRLVMALKRQHAPWKKLYDFT